MTTTPPLSLLLVDDSRVARLTLMRQLKTLPVPLNVLEAASADEAEVLASEHVIDLALIDFNMPGRDGIALAEVLKQRYPKLRMALVTANIQDALAERARALGMGFVAKPTRPEQLAALIEGEA